MWRSAIVLVLLLVACTEPTPEPEPPPDIAATVQAAMREAAPTPAPTPDVDATVQARVEAIVAALPSPTPLPIPTATPFPTVTPTPTSTPTPPPTATPSPMPTPTPAPTATPVPTPSLSAIIEQVKQSVVRVETRRRAGSGIIFKVEGDSALVVTNHHIFPGASQVTVTVGTEETEYRAELLGQDETHDLAVLRICCGSFRAASFGDVSQVKTGEEVVLIGYALDLEGEATVTRGIISAVRYSDFVESDVIQTDAAANPGNSGGPMISTSGEVLGILTFGYRETEGLSFAISAETVQERIPAMLAGPVPELLKSFGPLEGDHEAGLVRSDAAMLDFSVEITVTNPKTREQNWNYLLILRGSEADMENPNREPLDGEGVEFNPHDSINGFDPSPGAPNHIRVIAIDDRAWVIVNGVLGQTVDLRDAWRAGEVAFLNRPREGSGASGEVTFEEFQGLELRPLFGPEDGQLEPVPGRIATHDSGVFAKDFVADATFTRSQTQWDYGFKFRAAGGDPDVSDQFEAVGITFRGSWYHYRWQQGVGFKPVAEGQGVSIKREVHLRLIAVGDTGWLFLDGDLLTTLNLKHNEREGEVAALASLFMGNVGVVGFEGFRVWEASTY